MYTKLIARSMLAMLLLLATIAIPCFSQTIVATGTGSTQDAARDDALRSLSTQIRSTVNTMEVVNTIDTQDGSTNKSTYIQNSNVSTDLVLLGVSTKETQDKNGTWTSTATLDDSSIPLYHAELIETQRAIEELAAAYSDSASNQVRKRNLATQLSYYAKFETYRVIAVRLGDTDIPKLEKTRIGVELSYQELLAEEQADLETLIGSYDSNTISSLQSAAYNDLQKAKAELEANKSQQALFIEENIRRQEEAMQGLQQQNQQKLDSMNFQVASQLRNINAGRDANALSAIQLVDSIESKKGKYEQMLLTVKAEVTNSLSASVADLNAQLETLQTKPYPAAEMSNGQPLARAVQKRQQQIEQLQGKIDAAKQTIANQLLKSVDSQVQQVLDSIYDDIDTLAKSSYTLDSTTDYFKIMVDSYDGERCAWPFAIKTKLFGKTIQLDGYISYEQLTGETLPSFTSIGQDYDTYVNNVEVFQAFLLGGNALRATIDYDVQPGSADSSYDIFVTKVKVSRLDNSKTIMTMGSQSRKVAFTYTSTPAIQIPQRSESVTVVLQQSTPASTSSTTDLPLWNEYNPRSYAPVERNGVIIGYGLNLGKDSNGDMGLSMLVSTEYAWSPIPYFYCGPALDCMMSMEKSTPSDQMMRMITLSAMVGGYYSFRTGMFGMSVYADVRLGSGTGYEGKVEKKFETFDSILNAGLSIYVDPDIWLDFGAKVKMSGLQAGKVFVVVNVGFDF